MRITVEVADEKIIALVEQRIAELFSDDARFRDSVVRDTVRRMTDDAAVEAVRGARDAIADKLPAMAAEAVDRAIKADLDNAVKRGLSALRKLYVGFDPAKLAPDQRAWLEKQIASAASAKEGEPK